MSQRELAARLHVHERSVGNWERGATVPRNREAAIRAVLAEYWPGEHGTPPATPRLATASDAELLAEIARRFARTESAGASEPWDGLRVVPADNEPDYDIGGPPIPEDTAADDIGRESEGARLRREQDESAEQE